MTKRRVLYLPVETKARELLGKTFLAARAVERGWLVVLGRQREVFKAAAAGPAGAGVENGIPEYKASRLEASRQRGHRVVNLCEENIVYSGGWDYCNRKVGASALQHTDLLCVSGESNAGHLREFRPESSARIRLTGNPRFDTLMPAPRVVYEEPAQKIRQEFGKFLLVNTNFATANPFKRGDDRIAAITRRGKVANSEHAELLTRWRTYKVEHMQRLQRLVAEISASGAFERIVIRPHPVENHEVWREWAEPLGIEVRYQGNANMWILAASAVLHTGCTTGMEGVLLDRPVASFVFDPQSEFLNCTDEVSVQVSSADEFLARVAEWRTLPQDGVRAHLAPQRAAVRKYIDNVDLPLSSDRILDAIEELDLPEYSVSTASSSWGMSWKARSLLAAGRAKLRRLRDGSGRTDQKFPSLALEEMTEPITSWVSAGVIVRAPTFTKLSQRVWLLT